MSPSDPPTPRQIRSRLNDMGPADDSRAPTSLRIVGVPSNDETETDAGTDGGDETTERDVDDGRDGYPSFTVEIPGGEVVSRVGEPEAHERVEDCEDAAREGTPDCETCGLNPAYPACDGACVACAGLPRQDWPDHITDPDGEDAEGE